MHDHEVKPERALLIGLDLKHQQWPINDSLNELEELAQTAGLVVLGRVIQAKTHPDPVFYVGKGKLEELAEIVLEKAIEVVISDDELTPNQSKKLEERLKIKIIDRTGLILDIFAQRARTHEAQLQVELAQLQYLMPRLTRMWTHLSRLGGGIGTRGPGEKQLEVDRRTIRKQISVLKDDLDKIKLHRKLHRAKRQSIPVPTAALIGYTNAGKSTLMNYLTQADVLAENKLFATLDPTTRRMKLPDADEILLTDTVGFIQKLPHLVVESFHATLEESIEADVMLHLVDISHPRFQDMIDTAMSLLAELKIQDKTQILVFNKIDQVSDPEVVASICQHYPNSVAISAKYGHNMTALLQAIKSVLESSRQEMTFRIPYQRMDIVNLIYSKARIIEEAYADTILLKVDINTIVGHKIMGMLYRA